MAAFDFPSSPTVGQTYAPAGGPTYQWNGYAWVVLLGAGNSFYTKAEVDALLRPPVFFAQLGSAQNLTNNATTVLLLPEIVDTANGYDPATGRFTPNVAGWYILVGGVQFGGGAATRGFSMISKNGVEVVRSTDIVVQNTTVGIVYGASVSAMMVMNGTTDYATLGAFTSAGTQATALAGSLFSGTLARRT